MDERAMMSKQLRDLYEHARKRRAEELKAKYGKHAEKAPAAKQDDYGLDDAAIADLSSLLG